MKGEINNPIITVWDFNTLLSRIIKQQLDGRSTTNRRLETQYKSTRPKR